MVIKAADRFHTQTPRPNEMWQTDFTCFKIIGWGWMCLSTVLDDYSRYIISWKLRSTMRAEGVTDTLDLALRLQIATRPMFTTGPGCSAIMPQLHRRRTISSSPMASSRGAI